MRSLLLMVTLSFCAFGQGFVRPWVVRPPEKPAGGLRSPFLEAAAMGQEQAPAPAKRRVKLPEWLSVREGPPFPLVLMPCTSFPGNPVFVIEGDQVRMWKLDR